MISVTSSLAEAAAAAEGSFLSSESADLLKPTTSPDPPLRSFSSSSCPGSGADAATEASLAATPLTLLSPSRNNSAAFSFSSLLLWVLGFTSVTGTSLDEGACPSATPAPSFPLLNILAARPSFLPPCSLLELATKGGGGGGFLPPPRPPPPDDLFRAFLCSLLRFCASSASCFIRNTWSSMAPTSARITSTRLRFTSPP
mmetsp:Transcript_1584/g.3780  ORF Transcript_1584/g.3780 Transcript_1584/m.3780 type:complete len:200 (-) Transcript_1584:1291-1890(-)